MWWQYLTRLENEFDYQMFENGGWKWVGGFIFGGILVLLLK